MNTYKQWQRNLLNSIQLQLFISFISLPFLIAWGLPISLLSPISTLLFGPFLTCFLCIASLIFFLELLYLPNTAVIWILEKITSIWISCLGLEQRIWLIGFYKPSFIILCCIPLVALIIIHHKKITCIIKRIIMLASALIMVCIVLKLFSYHKKVYEKIPCNKGEITLINHNKTLIMFDPGYMASSSSYESYISFTLLPAIIEKTGKLEIDHVIIGKINKRILDALCFLTTKIHIKNIYLPYWNGKVPTFMWKAYIKLKNSMHKNNGKIISVSYKRQLYLDEKTMFTIESIKKEKKYYDATYYPLSFIGNNEIS